MRDYKQKVIDPIIAMIERKYKINIGDHTPTGDQRHDAFWACRGAIFGRENAGVFWEPGVDNMVEIRAAFTPGSDNIHSRFVRLVWDEKEMMFFVERNPLDSYYKRNGTYPHRYNKGRKQLEINSNCPFAN